MIFKMISSLTQDGLEVDIVWCLSKFNFLFVSFGELYLAIFFLTVVSWRHINFLLEGKTFSNHYICISAVDWPRSQSLINIVIFHGRFGIKCSYVFCCNSWWCQSIQRWVHYDVYCISSYILVPRFMGNHQGNSVERYNRFINKTQVIIGNDCDIHTLYLKNAKTSHYT